MHDYLDAIQILDPMVVKFLMYNAPKLAKKWDEEKYLFRPKCRYMNIVDYFKFSERVQNLMQEHGIMKTDLLVAFRADMNISEATARKIMQKAIDEGELKQRITSKVKWISL